MKYAMLAAGVLMALAACDDKPFNHVDDQASEPDRWIARSEKICGPGYLALINGERDYCIAYKLPDEAMR